MAKANRVVEEVRPKNTLAQGGVQHLRVTDAACLAEMLQHPSSSFSRRLIGIERVENIEIRNATDITPAKIQITAQARLKRLLGNADILRPCESSDDMAMVGRVLTKRARFENSGHQCKMFRLALRSAFIRTSRMSASSALAATHQPAPHCGNGFQVRYAKAARYGPDRDHLRRRHDDVRTSRSGLIPAASSQARRRKL